MKIVTCHELRRLKKWVCVGQIRRWMKEAGMRTWQDGVGNVHGRIDGRARDAPALISGSHYDTVMDAGKYDGALGIIVAIASVKATILQVLRCASFHH
jgi:allantoate deiminase